MKVIHLSTSNDGGAGIAAYRLHRSMLELGIESEMLVLCSKNSDPTVKVINTVTRPCLGPGPGISPHFYVHEQHRKNLMDQHPLRDPNEDIFNDASSEVVLEDLSVLRNADIINLHWVAGLIDYARIAHTLHGKKVVWTLHSMYDFTGGCCHAHECLKYTKECTECPLLGTHCFDYANHIFRQKYYGIQALDVTAVCPSNWLMQCAVQSAIFAGKSIHHIPNGIPLDIFKPMESKTIRDSFGIPADRFVILFGAFNAANKLKGFQFIESALKLIPQEICDKITVLGFGSASERILSALPCEVKGLGSICDEQNLAMIYAMADLFVMPSMAENLPSSIIESIACGTPVVAFRIGGIPDIVEHKVNGYLAAPFKPEEIAEGILWCRNNQTLLLPDICASTVRYKFNGRTQAMRYVSLYQNLLASPVPPADR